MRIIDFSNEEEFIGEHRCYFCHTNNTLIWGNHELIAELGTLEGDPFVRS